MIVTYPSRGVLAASQLHVRERLAEMPLERCFNQSDYIPRVARLHRRGKVRWKFAPKTRIKLA